MKLLRSVIVVLVAVCLGLLSWAMPASAAFNSSPLTMADQAMSPPVSHAHGCDEHGPAKKSETCCSQCPCCLSLLPELILLPLQRMPLPIVTPPLLNVGLSTAPDPAPPRFPA